MGDSNFRPQDGAYARVDLTFRSRRYMAGEPFPVENISDDKLRELHAAKRIAFGRPPQSLIDRARSRIDQLEGGGRSMTEEQAKDELAVNAPPGPAQSVQAKLKAKLAEQRADRESKRERRVSSVKVVGRKGPVKTDVRALRAAQGRTATSEGEDPNYVAPVPAKPDDVAAAGTTPIESAPPVETKPAESRRSGSKPAPIVAPR